MFKYTNFGTESFTQLAVFQRINALKVSIKKKILWTLIGHLDMLKYALFCPIFRNEKCLIVLIIRHLRNFAFQFSGAGGDRTRVQTRNKGAFYMFILLLIVGTKSGNRHPNRILISFILLARRSFG
jgi:hypothetical protein